MLIFGCDFFKDRDLVGGPFYLFGENKNPITRHFCD